MYFVTGKAKIVYHSYNSHFKDCWLLLNSLPLALWLRLQEDLSTSALCRSAAGLWVLCCRSVKLLLLLEERLPQDSWTISPSVRHLWPDSSHSVKARLHQPQRLQDLSTSALCPSAADPLQECYHSVKLLLLLAERLLQDSWTISPSAVDLWLSDSWTIFPSATHPWLDSFPSVKPRPRLHPLYLQINLLKSKYLCSKFLTDLC